MNKDNKCEVLTAPNCSAGRHNNFYLGDIQNTKKFGVYAFQGVEGCSQCSGSTYTGVINHANFGMKRYDCMVTDYINENKEYLDVKVNEVSKYIDFCKNYKNNEAGDLLCGVCRDGYILSENSKVCRLQNENLNCKITKNDTTGCKECLETHALVRQGNNDVCVENSIVNCLVPEFLRANVTVNVECKTC